MASEYLKWKYRDVKPEPPPPPLTGREKLKNWLHYNKWWLLVAAVLLWITGSMLANVLGIGQVKPDYVFAYIGRSGLPDDCAADLEQALASLGQDINGDGRVEVELRQYALDQSGDAETALYYNYAADTLLLADITAGDSYFFFTDEPESVQRAYQIFAQLDGSPPEDSDFGAEDKVYSWSGCPVLSALPVEQEPLSGLYFGRRCFYDERQAAQQAANEEFWKLLTEGAQR